MNIFIIFLKNEIGILSSNLEQRYICFIYICVYVCEYIYISTYISKVKSKVSDHSRG